MDILSPQQRHDCMASVRSKDTKPELIVRKALWNKGFR
ncbi:MAG: very short patch repair endonuclease, partial [Bacteroidaceae bacterium]|nr:very short patch repair endonuclease [Bacteroidaceae bacterium]